MKYIVFDVASKLQNNLVGDATITSNPIRPYRTSNHGCTVIYKTQDSAVEGSFRARVSNGKMYINNGAVLSISVLPDTMRIVVFEPDSTFKTLGTGHCKQIIPSKIKEENVKETAFLLGCKKDGPKVWSYAVLNGGTLDFGSDSTEAEILMEIPNSEKK